MKYISLMLALTLMMARPATADVAITGLPAVVAANVGSNDVFPFVQLSTGRTSKFKIAQILSIPALQSPTFTGTLTSALIVAGSGGVSAPSITVGDSTSGWYRGAANDIRTTISGIQTMRVSAALVGMPVSMYMNVLGTAAVENLISTNVNDNTLRLTGDVASGVGGEIKLGSRNAGIGQVVQIYTAGLLRGSVSAAGLWTIGTASGTQVHRIWGSVNIGDGTDGVIVRPDGTGAALDIANGDIYSFGSFNVRNSSGSATRLSVTDAGLVTIGTAAGTQAHIVNGTLTIIPATSGADLSALFIKAATTTGTVRNYWKNSDATRSFEIDADFSSGTENLLFQSDSAGIGGFSRAGAWTIGGNGLTNIHRLNIDTQSTVGAAGGASALPATPTGYLKFKVNGTTTFVVPYYAAS